MKKFTVVINTINRLSDLKRALKSVEEQSYKNWEVLVIDNGSTDGTVEYLKKKSIRYITDTTKKLSYLFNLGWKNAETEYLAYLADDAEAHKDWLKNIAKNLNRDRKVGVVGGPIISKCYPASEMHRLYLISQRNRLFRTLTKPYFHFVMESQPLAPGKLFESGAYSLGAGLEESKNFTYQETDLLTTTSMGTRKSVLEEVGGFDENFNFNHADGDFFVRVKKAGYKNIFDPRVVGWHYVRPGPSRSPFMIGRDTAYFLCKDIRPKSLRGLVGFVLNIFVLNCYWVLAVVKFKSLSQLLGIVGFFVGTKDYFKQ